MPIRGTSPCAHVCREFFGNVIKEVHTQDAVIKTAEDMVETSIETLRSFDTVRDIGPAELALSAAMVTAVGSLLVVKSDIKVRQRTIGTVINLMGLLVIHLSRHHNDEITHEFKESVLALTKVGLRQLEEISK